MKIYIIDNHWDKDPNGRFEGAKYPIVKWTDVCHQRPFMAISYDSVAKRPWKVRHITSWFSDTKWHYSTLASAQAGARRWAKEFARV